MDSTTKQRLEKLATLDYEPAVALLFMWIKSGTFTKRDMSMALDVMHAKRLSTKAGEHEKTSSKGRS